MLGLSRAGVGRIALMRNVIAWIAGACLVVACAAATTVASRLAYGDSRSIGLLPSAALEARFRRARSVGWLCSLAWILSAILALLVFWPPTGWVVGTLTGTAVLLVAILVGLDHPRTFEVDEGYFDE